MDAPARGTTSTRQSADGLEEQRGIGLQATPLLGLQQFEEADLVQIRDRRVRNAPQAFGLLSAVAQPRQKLVDTGENSCASRC